MVNAYEYVMFGIAIIASIICIGGLLSCTEKPHYQVGPQPTCDVVCHHIEDELRCPKMQTTANQDGCMAMCDNLFDTDQGAILNCWVASTSCAQLDTCDQ